jgi:hypothetical protein
MANIHPKAAAHIPFFIIDIIQFLFGYASLSSTSTTPAIATTRA